jgi:hypothetical protein
MESMRFSLWKGSDGKEGADAACIMDIGSIKQNL